MAFLELKGLSKRYGAQTVVDRLDLSAEKGELICLLGPSGCGKTTTLRLIAGFAAPDEGEIRIDGKVLSRPGTATPPERRSMSMIFQSYALWPHMSVFENVAYGLRLRRLSDNDIREEVKGILAVTRLTDFAERYPAELSGGQQQRVSLARALVVKPAILLLDEPLSNLDANLREEMRFEIRSLHDQYRYTTVYVTHDQTEAMTTADRVVIMNKGKIEQQGTPEEIYREPQSEFVARFIGGTNILKGTHEGGNAVRTNGGLLLHCGSGSFNASGTTAVSIRHHDVVLAQTAPMDGGNTAAGTVLRQIYLGSHRDYLVRLAGGETVRAVAPVDVAIAAGHEIFVHFPPRHCRALAH
jgi:iron(III) transport system ATP-binding protein